MSFTSSRLAAGLSIDEVSREFDVPRDTVRNWENGRGGPPRHVIKSLDVIGAFAASNPETPPLEAVAVAPDAPNQPPVALSAVALRASPKGDDPLIKSRQRVADHGEVFTPQWLVEKMLDLVKGETERIDSRFLEPACGSGNFLVPILQRKLAAVEAKYGKSDFEKRNHALQALTCCYGIELLADNIAECRANMLAVFASYLGLEATDELYRAASHVLSLNLIHGDAMTMADNAGQPITVVEWGYLGRGKFQRRDFRLDVLTGMSAFREERTLFAGLGNHEIFLPVDSFPPMTVRELAAHDAEPTG